MRIVIRELFADLELVLLNPSDVLVAAGWVAPTQWDGDPAHLPEGYAYSLGRAVEGHERGIISDTKVILAAQIHPDRRSQGLAAELLTAMHQQAGERDWHRVVAPVRPTLKARYPLTPIDRFATWTRGDGAPLDPWLRTHHRLGATVIATAPRPQTKTGTVAQWEQWTDMPFPDSGDYVIPDGLNILQIDRGTDAGTYTEPRSRW